MRKSLTRALCASLIAGLTACGGGGGSASLPLPSSPTGGGLSPNASVVFVVKIPPKNATGQARGSKYITSWVQGVAINVTQTPASAYTGYNFYPVGQNEPYCTGGTGGTAITCSLALQAPPGNDTFAVSTYDSPNYAGRPISFGTVTAQIAAGVSNQVNIATGGTVGSIAMGIDNPVPPTGAATTVPIRAEALDFDDNIIIGAFDAPLNVADSDATGATKMSASTVSGSSDLANLSLTYSGAIIPSATISLQATSVNSSWYGAPASASVLLSPGAHGITVSPSVLVFAGSTAAGQTVTLSGVGTTAPYAMSTGCTELAVSGSSPAFTVAPTQNGSYPTMCQMSVSDSSVSPLTGSFYAIVQGQTTYSYPASLPVLGNVSIGGQQVSAYTAPANGHALYTWTGDAVETSNCTSASGCTGVWTPYTAPAGTASSSLPAGFMLVTRSDGSLQYAYQYYPLYTYSGDTSATANGQHLSSYGGTWAVAKPLDRLPGNPGGCSGYNC